MFYAAKLLAYIVTNVIWITEKGNTNTYVVFAVQIFIRNFAAPQCEENTVVIHRTTIYIYIRMDCQKMAKRTAFFGVLLASALSVSAQSGTNSPYSQYGLGVLSDQSAGMSRGMGGIGIGLRSNGVVNTLNPASYSAVDSLTMIFDVGLSGQITSFKEGNVRKNANNADFEYATAKFRALPSVGVSFGLLPYTNIGYSYNNTSKVGGSTLTATETYTGEGGVHQAFLGVGWEVVKGLSVGANVAYLWGSYDRKVKSSISDSYANTMTRAYSASISNYKLDFGVQWMHAVGKNDLLTAGAVFGLGHKLSVDPQVVSTTTNTQTNVTTSSTKVASNGWAIPNSYGVGLTWQHGTALTVGADYSLQTWGSVDCPEVNNSTGEYVLRSGLLSDKHKVAVGAQWMPNGNSRNFFNRVQYRIGATYSTPYIKVNGNNGPKEYGVTAGFGIPVANGWNSRSMLNISAQWTHASATGLITENTFRINIGLTFNERWFMKWKVE